MGFAAETSAYTGGMADAYLRAPVGATAQAMGGAAMADPTSFVSMWNPAALTSQPLKVKRLSLGTGLRSMGRVDGAASLEFRIPTRMGAGLSVLYRGNPSIEIYNDEENKVANGSYTTITGKFGLSYVVTRALSAGISVGMNYQNLPADYQLDGAGLDYAWAFSIGGIDLGMRYQLNDDVTLALVAQNFNVLADWQFAYGGYDQTSNGEVPPSIALASRYVGLVGDKPLIWACDVKGYLLTGALKPLDHPSAVINNGVEWRRWDTFFLRAGIGELSLDGRLLSDSQGYTDNFWLNITAGFAADLSKVAKGMKLNYGISLGKAWSGVDQQIDVGYSF